MDGWEIYDAIEAAAKSNGIEVDWASVELLTQGEDSAVYEAIVVLDGDRLTVSAELKDAVINWHGWVGEYWYADEMKVQVEENWTTQGRFSLEPRTGDYSL